MWVGVPTYFHLHSSYEFGLWDVDYVLRLFQGEGDAGSSGHSDEVDCLPSTEISSCASGSSENWMVLSIAGDKPTPRSNVCNLMILLLLIFSETANIFIPSVPVYRDLAPLNWTMVK